MERVRSACGCIASAAVWDLGVAIVSLTLAANVGAIYGPPHLRPFFEGDPTISYPKVAKETVTFAELCIYSALIPTILSVVIPLVIRAHVGWSKPVTPVTDAWRSFTTLITAGSLTAFVTTYLKRYAGRPRPNFFALCEYQPFIAATQTYGIPHHLGTLSNCTGSTEDVLQAHLSFPSGHSSWSFCGLGFVSLLIYFSLWSSPKAVETFAAGLPLFFATLIAASRTRDDYHHFADVLTGAVLGGSITVAVFWTYYPRVQPQPERPASPGWVSSPHAPLRPSKEGRGAEWDDRGAHGVGTGGSGSRV